MLAFLDLSRFTPVAANLLSDPDFFIELDLFALPARHLLVIAVSHRRWSPEIHILRTRYLLDLMHNMARCESLRRWYSICFTALLSHLQVLNQIIGDLGRNDIVFMIPVTVRHDLIVLHQHLSRLRSVLILVLKITQRYL